MLDGIAMQGLDNAEHGSATGFDRVALPCGSRWHCIQTHPNAEHRAFTELTYQGFTAYLPLHLEPTGGIVVLFPQYLFARFDARRDPWGPIRHTRGVIALVSHGIGQPTPIRPGVVEDLIARTSPRRIVDDPGSAPWPNPKPERRTWQAFNGLTAEQRTALLLRLFG